jgi:hypothetical protein
MNELGAERLIRTLTLMQGPLSALGGGAIDSGAGGGGLASAAGCARAYERAKGYYTLITLPAHEVVRLAVDRPARYTPAEWGALLSVRVPGRVTADAHIDALRRALDRTYALSPGAKVAVAVESRVQAPVASLAGNIAAGLRGSVQQARALLKQAAEATTAAVQQAGASGGHGRPSGGPGGAAAGASGPPPMERQG